MSPGSSHENIYVTATGKKYFILKDSEGEYLTPAADYACGVPGVCARLGPGGLSTLVGKVSGTRHRRKKAKSDDSGWAAIRGHTDHGQKQQAGGATMAIRHCWKLLSVLLVGGLVSAQTKYADPDSAATNSAAREALGRAKVVDIVGVTRGIHGVLEDLEAKIVGQELRIDF